MAFQKALVASIFVLLVVVQVQAAQINQRESNAVSETTSYSPQLDCGRACSGRCRLSKRPNLCRRACGTCCLRCNCVPPGTYGNFDACPCYATMTTRDNRRKCP